MKFKKGYFLLTLPFFLLSCDPNSQVDLEIKGEAKLSEVEFSKTETRKLQFINSGEKTLQIYKTKFDFPSKYEEIKINESETTCKAGKELEVGQSCAFSFSFTPKLVKTYTAMLTLWFSRPGRDKPEDWLSKNYSFTAKGSLDCTLDDLWQEKYDQGAIDSKEAMKSETKIAKIRAASKTEQDGYDLGFEEAYQEFYETSYKESYEKAYKRFYSKGYSKGYSDLGSCNSGSTDGRFDGEREGRSDGESDGYSEGHSSGYDSGYSDGFSSGKSGHQCSSNSYLALTVPSSKKGLDPTLPNLCESKGFADAYNPEHFQDEYEAFLLKNHDYQRGLRKGKSEGEVEGEEKGSEQGTQKGEEEGFRTGMKRGKEDIYDSCYSSSYSESYKTYYSRGYSEKYSRGEYYGYSAGFNDGENAGRYSAQSECESSYDDDESDYDSVKSHFSKESSELPPSSLDLNPIMSKSYEGEELLENIAKFKKQVQKDRAYEAVFMRPFELDAFFKK